MACTGVVRAISFNHDGTKVLGFCDDSVLRVWDGASGNCERTMTFPASAHLSCFTANGELIALVDEYECVNVYSTGTGERVLSGQSARQLTTLEFSRDGKRLAAANWDGTVTVYSTDDRAEIARLSHPGRVVGLSFSPDGSRILTAAQDLFLRIWYLGAQPTGSRLPASDLVMCTHPITALANSHWGSVSAAALTTGFVTVAADRRTFRVKQLPKMSLLTLMSKAPVRRMTFSNDQVHLCTLDADGSIGLRHFTTGRLAGCLPEGDPVQCFSLDATGLRLATGGEGGASLWDARPCGDAIQLLHEPGVAQLSCSSDGRSIAAFGENWVTVWSTAPGRELTRYRVPSSTAGCALSSDGSRMLFTDQQSITVLEVLGDKKEALPLCPDPVTAASFSADDQIRALVYSSGAGWKLLYTDPKGSKWQSGNVTQADGVLWGNFSEDGNFLVGTQQRKAVIFDCTQEQLLTTEFLPDESRILAVAAGGQYLAAATYDKATVWDVKGSSEVSEFRVSAQITALAFSSVSNQDLVKQRTTYLFISAGKDITCFTVRDDDLITEVGRRVERALTQDEVRMYAKMDFDEPGD